MIPFSKQERIYREFYPKVFGYLCNRTANRQDAEDLAQTVFVKVFENLERFEAQKSSLSTWIFHITRNTLTNHGRYQSLRLHEQLPEQAAAEDPDLAEHLILEEEQSQLVDALAQLTEPERDLVILHYYEEHTLTSISQMMHLSYGQVKRLHNKALEKLARYMNGD